MRLVLIKQPNNRFSLAYKGLPYKTVWVELSDIATTLKAAGIPPSSIRPDGTPDYTCPAIYDPSTKTSLSESALIAEYLDKQYPDTPKIFPVGSRALQYAFLDQFLGSIVPLFQFAVPATYRILNKESDAYFRATREAMFGTKIENITPTGAEREVEWAKVKAVFNTVDGWLQLAKADGPYLLGKEPGFVDFVVAGYVLWMKNIWGDESAEWKDIKTWNEGRWEKYIDGLKVYRTATV